MFAFSQRGGKEILWKRKRFLFERVSLLPGAAAIVAAAAFIPIMSAPLVSTAGYNELKAEGAEDVGYEILSTNRTNPRFGQADNYKFIINYNGQPKTVIVDEATYNTYSVGNYITCAYLYDGKNVQIAAKPVGYATEQEEN